MRMGTIQAKVCVGFLGRVECPCEPHAEFAVHIMIARYYEQAALIKVRGAQQVVEELFGQFVFRGLSRVRNVSSRKEQVGSTSSLAIISYGSDQGLQNDI